MAALDPSVAAVRRAVRSGLDDVDPGDLVLVACSGGADSLALAAATRFEARAAGWQVGAVVVDHGLQPGSGEVAAGTARVLRGRGLDPVDVVPVDVVPVGVRGSGGPESAARTARFAALQEAAGRHRASAVLLGHTRDDQAETVLLGLARGSGARSLSGMAPRAGLWRRPLLDISREQTEAACAAEGLTPWEDPHNVDPRFSRVRVRTAVLPLLEAELGPGVTDALARTARLLRADADALEALAVAAAEECRSRRGLDVAQLEALAPAVRSRVLHVCAVQSGCPRTDLTARHVDAVDALVTSWHGQRWVDLPGGVRASRDGGELRFVATAVAG